MQLPFTHEQFLDVFEAYNNALWVPALFLWLASLAIVARWLRDPDSGGPWLTWLLSVHWLWSGGAYHLAFFSDINPAALAFGILFLLQGALFLWFTRTRRRLHFNPSTSAWGIAGLVLVAYSLLYPLVGMGFGLEYPRMPTFGVPCPTALLTAGLLILTTPRAPRALFVIPVAWAAVGGFAAFELGIRADAMLVVAGVAMVARIIFRGPARPLYLSESAPHRGDPNGSA